MTAIVCWAKWRWRPRLRKMKALIDRDYRTLDIEQDLGLGMMLWFAHFYPEAAWAKLQSRRAQKRLTACGSTRRDTSAERPARSRPSSPSPITESVGLQAAGCWPERVHKLNTFFETWRSGDEYDTEAITWVMACVSHLPGVFLRNDRP